MVTRALRLSRLAPNCKGLDPPAIGRFSEVRAPALIVLGDKDAPDIHAIGELIYEGVPRSIWSGFAMWATHWLWRNLRSSIASSKTFCAIEVGTSGMKDIDLIAARVAPHGYSRVYRWTQFLPVGHFNPLACAEEACHGRGASMERGSPKPEPRHNQW